MVDTASSIRAEANISDRPGQYVRLMVLADDAAALIDENERLRERNLGYARQLAELRSDLVHAEGKSRAARADADAVARRCDRFRAELTRITIAGNGPDRAHARAVLEQEDGA